MRKPKPTKIITWTSWKAVQREGTVSSARTAGLQVPHAFGVEKKLITSVAVGGKFKRKCVFASCPMLLSLKMAQLLEIGFWLKGSAFKVNVY